MIEIVIDPDYCKGCGICVEYCPRNVFLSSEEINARGYRLPEIVDIDACTQCQLCVIICPDLAIAVTPKDKQGGRNARK
jgi:2-oxoglutarate ferredoxin oxidoreductase subunit delta